MKPADINKRNCFNCGYVYTPNHKSQCSAAGKKCNFCGVLGHFQAVCRKRKKISVRKLDKSESSDSEPENDVVCKNLQQERHDFYTNVFTYRNPATNTKSSAAPLFKVLLNDEPVVLIGNTGATCSCINHKTFLKIQKRQPIINLLKTRSKIFSFGNKEAIKPLGKIDCAFEGNKHFYVDTIYVMPNNFENILSKTACEKLGYITIHSAEKVLNISRDPIKPVSRCVTQPLIEKYRDVFEDGGVLKGYEHKIYIDNAVKPVAQRLRRYPYQLRHKINAELDRLLKLDFIEKVEGPAEWISNMVVAPKKDGKISLCLDARAVNSAI